MSGDGLEAGEHPVQGAANGVFVFTEIADDSLQSLAIHDGKFCERDHVGLSLEFDFNGHFAVGRSFRATKERRHEYRRQAGQEVRLNDNNQPGYGA